MLTFTQARGPKPKRCRGSERFRSAIFRATCTSSRTPTTLDEAGAQFYDSIGLRSSLCMCVTRSPSQSLWIGYTGSAPYVFGEMEISELKAVSTLLGLLHHERAVLD